MNRKQISHRRRRRGVHALQSTKQFFWRIFALMLVFSICGSVRAERTRVFRQVFTPEGVNLPEVRDILEDETGAIWVATWGGGIHRIRGSQWKIFDKTNGLPDNWVRTLESDDQGGIWVGTVTGICRIQDDTVTILKPENALGLQVEEILKIKRVAKGKMWVSLGAGSIVACNFNGEKFSWEKISIPYQAKARGINDIWSASDGTIWLACKDYGILRYNGNKWDRPGDGDSIPRISRFLFETVETGIISSGAGIVSSFDGSEWSKLLEWKEWKSGVGPMVYHESELWIGGGDGVYRSKEDQWQKIDLGNVIGEPEIRSLEISTNGTLWIGTTQGLFRSTYNSWNRFSTTSDGRPLAHLISSSVFSTQPQAIDASNRIAVFENQEWNPKLQLVAADSIYRYWTFPGDNTLWAISETNLLQYSLADGSILQKLEFPNSGRFEFDMNLYRTSKGRICILTAAGVFQLENEGWLPIPDDPSYERRKVNTVLEVNPDQFYIGRYQGIDFWNGEEFLDPATFAPLFSDSNTDCRTICKLRDGSLWFGTFGPGIIVKENSSIRTITKQQGLVSSLISNIYEASDGTVWISYRRQGMASYRDGRWVNFLHETGLPNDSVTRIVESETGTIWISTENFGVFNYEPDHEPPDTFITTGSRKIDFRGAAVFSFFGKDSWDRTLPQNLLYSWRIIPIPNETESYSWSRFENLTAIATPSLESGDYLFEVRTSDTDRNIDPTPASFRFSVASPLWGRPGFAWPMAILGIIALIALLRAYSEHKRLQKSEENVRSMNSQLEQRVSDRTAELTVAYNEMEAFNAAVSHDLRSPLQSVYGFGCLLSKRLQKSQDERSNEFIKKITDEAHRMGTMIDQLLQFSKLGKKTLEKANINLEELVHEVKNAQQLEKTKRIIDWNILELPVVEADPVLIRQVLCNLIENAIKYSSTRAKAKIEIGCLPQNLDTNEWVIFVRDNGVGFNMTDANNLFGSFQRLHSQEQFKGTGIGLSNVKRIVERHGGRVWAEAEKDQGATFFFSMPGARSGNAPI